jgi:RimJ/RimL family protein N-acetyltransferase
MSGAELKRAERDLEGVVRSYGASLPHIGFWEMRSKRKIYRVKRELIEENPHCWLIGTSWLILHREKRAYIGEAGFKGPPLRRASVEIGYGILDPFRCQGYMTEAAGALIRLAFCQTACKVERVSALTLPENMASHRVLEKNGFERQPSFGKYWIWERVRKPEDTTEGLIFHDNC